MRLLEALRRRFRETPRERVRMRKSASEPVRRDPDPPQRAAYIRWYAEPATMYRPDPPKLPPDE